MKLGNVRAIGIATRPWSSLLFWYHSLIYPSIPFGSYIKTIVPDKYPISTGVQGASSLHAGSHHDQISMQHCPSGFAKGYHNCDRILHNNYVYSHWITVAFCRFPDLVTFDTGLHINSVPTVYRIHCNT